MSEATATTDQVRRLYAYTRAGDRIHRTDEYFAQFDRWLAAHDEQVRVDERERCAQAVDDSWDACGELIDSNNGARLAFEAVAAAIRAVSEQEEN